MSINNTTNTKIMPPSNSSEPAPAIPQRLSPVPSQPRPGTPASLQEHRHPSRLAQPRPASPSPSLPIVLPESQSHSHLRVPPRTPSPHPDGASTSRRSSRPSSLRLDTTASALFASPEARAVRANVYEEIVGGWSMLTTSSKALVLYYLLATTVEIAIVVTMCVIERDKARKCFLLVIFLGLYLARAIVLCVLLLRRFLFLRPNDLPQGFGEACGTHYKTMLNWTSLVLAMFSIGILTTQARCANESPALFYLVLVFSLVGYVCLAMLLLVWLVVMFCLNGLVALLEFFGIGPRVMQWEGATPEMIDDIPVIKFLGSGGGKNGNIMTREAKQAQGEAQSEKQQDDASAGPKPLLSHPSIVISEELDGMNESKSYHPGQGLSADAVYILDFDTPQPQQDQREHIVLEELDHNSDQDHDHSTPPLPPAPPADGALDHTAMSCVICLCEYEPDDLLRQMPCRHLFHKECVDEWLKLKRTCPLCKFDIARVNRIRNWTRQHFRRRSSGSGHGARTSI